ncbi:MAG: hypothetical protein GX242_05500 [Clostridiales bacterium]|nr:hypothetical protein [Clostridiales bacterium]
MKNKLLVCIALLVSFVMLIGCSDRTEIAVTSIDIKPNSFKTSYEIDEQLIFDNIFILVTYDNGESKLVPCDHSMIRGFDTTTTGEKQLYVEYGGVESAPVDYEVLYSKDNSKKIMTSARLEYNSFDTNEIVSYTINYFCGNLKNAQAIYFNLYSEDDLNINYDLLNVSFELPTGWSCTAKQLQSNDMRVLFYNKDNIQGLNSNTAFRININNGNKSAKAILRDIEISTIENDGAVKYYIPDYER